MPRPLPASELEEAIRIAGDWSALDGARVFITGGTGFFGKWLLETLGEAKRAFNLDVEAVVLSRDPARFLDAMPHLRSARWLSFHRGDIASFLVPDGAFSHLLHGAASADARDYINDPPAMKRAIVEGTRHALEAMSRQTSLRMLFLSSGAVYGPQPPSLARIPDDFPLPSDPRTDTPARIYAQAKREAEMEAASSCNRLRFPCPIARCFAFAGPHLPLDRHFAFGNFIGDALAGRPIQIHGDGSPRRSYLYASELAAWLWSLALRGVSTTYNVGSDQDVSIRDLAEAVGKDASVPVHIAGAPVQGQEPQRYVPGITKVQTQLGLVPEISVQESIRRTLAWHRG
jgi:dTDP-glucose 4,6-dehydratase